MTLMSSANTDLLADIRRENLNVYRSMPQRLGEDVGQEAQIAQDYRGRLIYELLQNADDAMNANDQSARICIRLTSESLWVANSGRPLDEADVRGLCGISASSKRVQGKRRASIGHKGMGFKSVLEITDAPEVYSTTTCFRFSPNDALSAVQPLVDEAKVEPVRYAPVCRFPAGIDGDDPSWLEFRDRGFHTAFRFPLRPGDKETQHDRLTRALAKLPISSLLFLKRLKSVQIELAGESPVEWIVDRQWCGHDATNSPVAGLSESGVYRVGLANGRDVQHIFLVAYDAEIPIGRHRGGLNEYAWDGVELTEAAIAARIDGGKATELPSDWRRLHVFLPSGEPCPYDLLISAAFNSNLSRQEIKVEANAEDYNRHLLDQVARLFRDQLLPALTDSGTDVAGVLSLLRRRNDSSKPETGAAQAVYGGFRTALAQFPFIPTESGTAIPIAACVVPPVVDPPSVGVAFRRVLPDNATHGDNTFPLDQFCGGDSARVLVDHGACELRPVEAAHLLAAADPERSLLTEHASGELFVDPVLSILEGLWSGLEYGKRAEFAAAVRQLPLFPTSETHARVTRVATKDLQCFYPPRSLRGEVGLSGLCFLLQELCWGLLNPKDRNAVLAKEMPVWQSLFEVREFKFPDVMRASVLPALDLDSDSQDPRRTKLRTFDSLAAICQLAGRIPDASKPLPYERLGPNRALFNLSRLDVPCRSDTADGIKWVPAYKVYMGEDWVGDASFERVCKTIASLGGTPPAVDFLVSPSRFMGVLGRFRHLKQATAEESDDVGADEVALDEDEEAALDSDDGSRWQVFFRWLGVNVALRAVHFHDVEDRASGWLKTRMLRKPEGWAFSRISDEKWEGFRATVLSEISSKMTDEPGAAAYFYQLHDLEHIVSLLEIATNDASATVGRAIYEHLARNWGSLERFSQLSIAIVTGEPARRVKPPRARDDEIVELDDSNFWVYRLRAAAVCPTGHGPRGPAEVWLPTQEVLRRFGRKNAVCLLPTIDLPPALLKGRSKGLTQAMGIREELSTASFSESDAMVVVCRLRELYGEQVRRGEDLRQQLREVIRPTYRHVLELLSGSRPPAPDSAFRQAPLLAQDGLGHFEFRAAQDVFYVERRDTRDRLQTNASLWTFVLEAYPAGRNALVERFGCRVLEDSLEWSPRVGDCAFPEAAKADWAARLHELAPYVLARVGADRVDETQARRDAVRLRNLILSLEPVTDIRLTCSLDAQELPSSAIEREAFVEVKDDAGGMVLAFVRWGESAWPPTEDDAEALATAFGEVLGSRYFESFLALIRAPTNAKRESLLRRAGAPTDIEEYRLLLFEAENSRDEVGIHAVDAVADDVAQGMTHSVGRGFFVAGADGSQAFGQTMGGGDQEMPGTAGGVADLHRKQSLLGE